MARITDKKHDVIRFISARVHGLAFISGATKGSVRPFLAALPRVSPDG